MSLVVGLTGTVGCGKTTVAALMSREVERRWPAPPPASTVIDADALAHEAVEPGQPALAEIVREHGPAILDAQGHLRRGELAKIVFADGAALERLEAILHPRVREMAVHRVEVAKAAGTRLIVLDVPLLLEVGGMRTMAERIVVVTVGEARRFGRLRERSGLTEAQVMARLARQMPQARKAALADAVIDNDGGLEATRLQCERLVARWADGGFLGRD